MEQAPRNQAKRVWESIELYTVQCAICDKWRLVPSKARYEEMQEQPFSCEMAREWRSELSCEDEPDIEQDEHLGWEMDRPIIPHTPPGWQRLIRVRAKGGSKFADVYYVSPSNKRLRSMAEVNRYLEEHPEYLEEGVDNSRFSFQAPAPLDKKYVSKRRVRDANSSDLQIIPIEVKSCSGLRYIPGRKRNIRARIISCSLRECGLAISGEPDIMSTEISASIEKVIAKKLVLSRQHQEA